MRKALKTLTIALTISASVPAFAQSQGAMTVKDGNGSLQSLCNVASASGSVEVPCANLYVQGAQVAATNPVPTAITGTLPAFAAAPTVNIGTAPAIGVTGTFWQATQPISATSLPLPTGAATATGLSAINTTLGAPFQAGGSIGNSSFGAIQSGAWNVGLTGTLPAFATTPTVNIGTAPSLTIGTLPALPAGSNVIGGVTISGTPSFTCASGCGGGSGGAVTQSGTWNVGLTGTLPAFAATPTVNANVATYAGTALTGSVTAYGTAPTGSVFGVNAAVTNTVAQNLAQIGGTAVNAASAQLGVGIAAIGGTATAAGVPNGSSGKALGVAVDTAVPNTDQSSTAFAGSGSVTGAVVASTTGGGAVISGEINVTALALGTASSVLFVLQEGRSNNFTDIWVSDPVTATGVVTVPPIPVGGRRRWRAFNVGGTSTTVTATITTLELPAGYVLGRQMRDAFATTNPFALQYNSTALTASNFVLGTVSTATTPFYVEGTKQITAFMTLAGSPTVSTQPVVTLQLSMDGTNFWSASATMTASGNGTYMTSYAGTAKFARLQVTTAAVYSSGAYTISNIGVNAVN